MKVGLVAGEASGDTLGAQLMSALRDQHAEIDFVGVGGVQMAAQGLVSLENMDRFAFNGFLEPLKRLPELLELVTSLADRLSNVDVMIGVDFNVFNLKLERRLKALGVPTVHYVSPSVYAWRRGRARSIEKSADLLLTLYPFEPKYYDNSQICAKFVGHPLADEIDPAHDPVELKNQTRAALGLSPDLVVVALLPGSRYSEVDFHRELFLETCSRFQQKVAPKQCQFIIPCGIPTARAALQQEHQRHPEIELEITEENSRTILAAADVALVKSGTSTLEAMLLRTPMVVTYRIGWLTYAIVRTLLRTPRVALPNILTNRELVPEFIQHRATAETLANNLVVEWRRFITDPGQHEAFASIHRTLRQNSSLTAAKAILDLFARSNTTKL